MKSPDVNWRAWTRKAGHDLLAIRSILAGEEVPWDVICFHAQQAAEKLLKALLVSHAVQPGRTHDLVALLRECTAYEPELACLLDDCRLLTAFAVQTRYPDDRVEPGQEDGDAALGALGRVRKAIQRCLPEQDGV
jgi:HEPN domain-containing protein